MTIWPVQSLTHLPIEAGSMIGLLLASKAIGRFGRCASVNSRLPLVVQVLGAQGVAVVVGADQPDRRR